MVAELHQDLGETGFSLGADYELLPTERLLIGVHAERVFGDLGRVAPYAGAAEIGIGRRFGGALRARESRSAP